MISTQLVDDTTLTFSRSFLANINIWPLPSTIQKNMFRTKNNSRYALNNEALKCLVKIFNPPLKIFFPAKVF